MIKARNFSDYIRTNRASLGLTLGELGDLIGCDGSTIGLWEHGGGPSAKLMNAAIGTIKSIGEVVGMPEPEARNTLSVSRQPNLASEAAAAWKRWGENEAERQNYPTHQTTTVPVPAKKQVTERQPTIQVQTPLNGVTIREKKEYLVGTIIKVMALSTEAALTKAMEHQDKTVYRIVIDPSSGEGILEPK